jgi:hypothetical protein
MPAESQRSAQRLTPADAEPGTGGSSARRRRAWIGHQLTIAAGAYAPVRGARELRVKHESACRRADRGRYGARDVASGFAAADFDGPVFDGSGGAGGVFVPAGRVARRRRRSRSSRLRLAARRDSSKECPSTCWELFFIQLSGSEAVSDPDGLAGLT